MPPPGQVQHQDLQSLEQKKIRGEHSSEYLPQQMVKNLLKAPALWAGNLTEHPGGQARTWGEQGLPSWEARGTGEGKWEGEGKGASPRSPLLTPVVALTHRDVGMVPCVGAVWPAPASEPISTRFSPAIPLLPTPSRWMRAPRRPRAWPRCSVYSSSSEIRTQIKCANTASWDQESKGRDVLLRAGGAAQEELGNEVSRGQAEGEGSQQAPSLASRLHHH